MKVTVDTQVTKMSHRHGTTDVGPDAIACRPSLESAILLDVARTKYLAPTVLAQLFTLVQAGNSNPLLRFVRAAAEYVCMYVSMFLCFYVYMYVYVCIYICIYAYASISMYLCM